MPPIRRPLTTVLNSITPRCAKSWLLWWPKHSPTAVASVSSWIPNRWAKETGADRIELYTEGYAAAYGTALEDDILQPYVDSALLCDELALGVNAGHDLSLDNLEKLLTACGNIKEVSIGHALTVEALQFGFAETIRRYNELLDRVAAKPRVFPQE